MAGDDIVDAEWEEVPDNRSALHVARSRPRPSAQPPSSGQSDQSVDRSPWFSLNFWGSLPWGKAIASIVGLFVLALILTAPKDVNSGSSSQNAETAAAGDDGELRLNDHQLPGASSQRPTDQLQSPAVIQVDRGWITGSWILTPKGGEDGQTRCDDFAAASIYRLNGNTAKIMTFRANGQYRDMFAYTTPSGEEHYTQGTATWQAAGDAVELRGLTLRDAFENRSDTPVLLAAEANQQNVMLLGDAPAERYVRCIGPTHDLYSE